MTTNLEAINALVNEHTMFQTARYGPLVALARTLAAQMDAAGTDPSTRLTAAYLSALKDIERALREVKTEEEKPGSKLNKFRAINGFKTG